MFRLNTFTILSCLAAGPAFAGHYTLTPISAPNGFTPIGIDDNGQVLGNAAGSAVFYTGGVAQPVNQCPAGQESVASSIDAFGDESGSCDDLSVNRYVAAWWVAPFTPVSESFSVPFSSDTYGSGADPSLLAGSYIVNANGNNDRFGFLLDSNNNFTQIAPPGSTETEVYGISLSNLVFGNAVVNGWSVPFLFQGGTYSFPAIPLTSATVTAANGNGLLIGSDTSGNQFAFDSVHNTYYPFQVPGLFAEYLSGVSATGHVAGFYYNNAHKHLFGFNWNPVKNTFVTLAAPAKAQTFAITGINTSGQLVGYYTLKGGVWISFIATCTGTNCK